MCVPWHRNSNVNSFWYSKCVYLHFFASKAKLIHLVVVTCAHVITVWLWLSNGCYLQPRRQYTKESLDSVSVSQLLVHTHTTLNVIKRGLTTRSICCLNIHHWLPSKMLIRLQVIASIDFHQFTWFFVVIDNTFISILSHFKIFLFRYFRSYAT